MGNKSRIIVLALLVALPVYLWLASSMPLLAPEALYGVAAGLGFVAGLVLNYLWQRLAGK